MTFEHSSFPVMARRLFVVALLVMAGCGERELSPDTIRKPTTMDKVPELVLKAAKKALPDVTFSDAFENLEKGVTLRSYEIRGKNASGKIREVRVSTTGEIEEME